MNEHIKNALLHGRLVLLLGAGASSNSINSLNKNLPMGRELSKILSDRSGITYSDEPLSDIYTVAKSVLGDSIYEVLEANFKHCQPASELKELIEYPFSRIYSLNIDDAIDNALYHRKKGKFNIRQRNDRIVDPDQFFETLDLIKLNGDITRVRDGFIFSTQEYAKEANNSPLWYEELAQDYLKYTFIFIGTKLNESLFRHQVERYKGKTNSSEQRSYILVPNLTMVEKMSLESSNIFHLSGTLTDFTNWLKKEFTEIPTGHDILRKTKPHLSLAYENSTGDKSILYGITPVSRVSLSLLENDEKDIKVKSFYKGYKASWHDILDGIPANLKAFSDFYKEIINNYEKIRLYTILGPAGSGKSTMLKQIALKIADETNHNVYFLENYSSSLKHLLQELDKRVEDTYFIFIERLGDLSQELAVALKQLNSEKAVIIGAENLSIYSHRVHEHIGDTPQRTISLNAIDESDVSPILQKIELYGNWTRLAKLSEKNRRIELIKKSKKQLLIGLLEVTSGEGFDEIIHKDYKNIITESHKALLLLTGLASFQGVNANETTLTRALKNLDLNPNVYELSQNMNGILKYQNGLLQTRHRVYVERLFDKYVSKEELFKIITAYIEAFSVYRSPIVLNIAKQESKVYKYLVNAKTLKNLFTNDEKLVLGIYLKFEKLFESDGLFLMQYGLALRSFYKNKEAYEKLRIAYEAYDSTHIEHALAQQRIILALEEGEEVIANSYFKMAEDTLNRLDKSDIMVYDRYPIIALSEGHIQFLHRFGHISEGKIYAKIYYDRLNKKSDNSPRMRQAKEKMMKYYTTGQWRNLELENL